MSWREKLHTSAKYDSLRLMIGDMGATELELSKAGIRSCGREMKTADGVKFGNCMHLGNSRIG